MRGMSMKVTQDGREYEFWGYCRAKKGEHYLGADGKIREASERHIEVSAIFRPSPKEYCFGNVVFQDTGEGHPPTDGDWWVEMYQGEPLLHLYRKGCGRTEPVRILKPVRLS